MDVSFPMTGSFSCSSYIAVLLVRTTADVSARPHLVGKT